MNVEHLLRVLVGGDIEAGSLGEALQQLRTHAAVTDDDALRKAAT
jgi:hypothetical protein